MATIGSAKATLVNKIDTLTASATAKDTIYLAKALKENTTHHSFTFQGAWAATTAYALDDVVTTSGKTYICILAYTSGASFAVGSNWSLMAEKGTDGTDLTSTLTTAGDVVYKGASALTRLAKGTASQVLTMNSGATAPEWSDAASGATGMDDVSGVARATSGLLFNGDTAAANVLDDYEEGTWSPSTLAITTTGSPAYSGTYTKIGNIVTAFFYSTTGGGVATYATSAGSSWFSLPFASANFNGYLQTQSGTALNGWTTVGGIVGTNSNTNCYFFTSISATSGISATITYHI